MNESTNKKRGRPVGYRAKNPSDKVLPKVRVTDTQLNSYKDASMRSEKTLSAWVRDTLDRGAKKK
ncbi:MAG: hypothetical protein GKR95_20045 [Gammaproteobacteria bacterium]|nr:hypothetical protein [Gammaproteobacteria bacterium]